MVLPYPTNNMKIRDKEYEPAYLRRAILCIAFGTGLGLFVYEIFLFFKRGRSLFLIVSTDAFV